MKKRGVRAWVAVLIVASLMAAIWFAERRVFAKTTIQLGSEAPARRSLPGNAPQPVVWYTTDVRLTLDDKQHPNKLEGREQLVWLNDSPDVISDLQFHLYLNAFKNEKSTFFRESGGQLRGDRFEPGEWGWIDVNEMKLAGRQNQSSGEDLTKKIEFIHPDDDNVDDQTVIRVPLPQPIKPGEKITLDIKFTAKLPRVFARTGYWDQFAMVAQWFPKIGVWEAVGERHRTIAGWNCHQFHANSEFYADFGNYDVTMTVPAIFKDKLGATGVMKSERANADGTITYRFAQENVHDFAWTVGAHYDKVTRTFNASEQATPAEVDEWAKRLNLPPEQIRLKDVAVTLLIQHENRGQTDRHFAAAFNAIKYFGLWYGKYPYETLTVIDPPFNADGAGGMEYPTLITAGTSWWPGRDQNPEEVIVHEFGHQYWYGMVASNEFEESWLDEGFNTYSTAKVLKVAYGPNVLPIKVSGIPLGYLPLRVPHPYEDRILTLEGKFDDPILTPAWKYYDSTSYGLNSYPRTGLTLNTLEGYLGRDEMARVMRGYFQKWQYRHPSSQDFFETASAVSGQDLTWFFDQFVKGTGTLDYEIAELKSERPEERAGVYDKDGQKVEVKDQAEDEKKPGLAYQNEVTMRRLGEAWFPMDLVLTFKDGSQITARATIEHRASAELAQGSNGPVAPNKVGLAGDGAIEYQFISSKDGKHWTEVWPIAERWKRFKFTTESELLAATLDPEKKVLLDANFTNNSKTTATGIGAAMRWSSGALFWLQALLQALSGLA